MIPKEEGLTIAEAAGALGCCERTIRRYVTRGLIVRTNTGRPALYSPESIAAVKGGVSSVLRHVAAINAQISELTVRVSLLETVFMARGQLIEPTDKLVRDVVAALQGALQSPMTLQIAADWADDLTRYSPDMCKRVGYTSLDTLARALMYAADSDTDARRLSLRRITVEQLRWFLTQLSGYQRRAK